MALNNDVKQFGGWLYKGKTVPTVFPRTHIMRYYLLIYLYTGVSISIYTYLPTYLFR